MFDQPTPGKWYLVNNVARFKILSISPGSLGIINCEVVNLHGDIMRIDLTNHFEVMPSV
jgi:hypothetical protein